MLQTISNKIDALNEAIGKGIAWLNTALVVLIFYDVVARYLFNSTFSAIIELEWHLFAFIFLIGAAYALKHDRHVRVDVFYANFTEKQQAWVNLTGTLLFLIPFCIIIIYTSFRFAASAYAINEGSPDPGGLPARYIVKAAIPIGFTLLLLQAISLLLKSILTLIHNKPANG
jgi:TRAP-type mannitol/chloroaromatic compound transport system permease small subunit